MFSMLSARKHSLTAQSSNGPCGLRCLDSVHPGRAVNSLYSAHLQSAYGIFSEEAHADLKKILKAWKALKPLQASGLLSGYVAYSPIICTR